MSYIHQSVACRPLASVTTYTSIRVATRSSTSRSHQRRWLDECLSEGYEHDGSGVCLGDGKTESYVKDMGMTGLASAWAMARRRTKEYRRQVDAATRRFGVCPPTPDLNFPSDLILFLNRGIGGESFRGSLCRRSTVRAVNQLE